MSANQLQDLRSQIDKLDEDLLLILAKRITIIRAIGELKKASGEPPLDKKRWKSVLQSRLGMARSLKLSEKFIEKLFTLIHEHALEIESGKSEETTPLITYADFAKLDIRIGRVVSVTKVEKADKLLKFIVDIGSGESRQILSGIAEFYPDYDTLVGQEVPILINLEPRTIRGLESQGMVLAADVGGRAVLLHPDREIPPGSTVR